MITFNGVYFRDIFDKIRNVKREFLQPQDLTSIEIPGRPGAYFVRRRDGVKTIKVTVTIYAGNLEAVQSRFKAARKNMIVEKPAEILLDDEPGVTYLGMISGSTEIEQNFIVGDTEITFICFEPYGEGEEKTVNLTAPAAEQGITVSEGTMETYPRYEFTLKRETTALVIQNVVTEENLIMGLPEDFEMPTVNPQPLFLHDSAQDLTPWQDSTLTPDGGIKAGGMGIQNGAVIYPSSYGTGASWHGPIRFREFSKALQNFIMVARITQNNAFADRAGRVEVYLTDELNNVIAKIAMKDVSRDFSNNKGEFRLGTLSKGIYKISKGSDNSGWWNNFYSGVFYMKREGRYITGRIARMDDEGNEVNVEVFEHYDAAGVFLKPFKRIHVHFGMTGTTGPTTQTFDDLKIFEINAITQTQIPVIGRAGDKITIDTKTGAVKKNGADFYAPLNGLSKFFPLQLGLNRLNFLPLGVADVSIKYKPRFR